MKSTDLINIAAHLPVTDPEYARVPAYCYAADVFTVQAPVADGADNDGDGNIDPPFNPPPPLDSGPWHRETRVWGRINVNTAPVAVLCTLPALADTATERLQLAGLLMAYRDLLAQLQGVPAVPPFLAPARRAGMNALVPGADFSGLRQEPGFATAGEVAMLLRAAGAKSYPINPSDPTWPYALGATGADEDGYATGTGVFDPANPDLSKLDMRYAYVANTVTVNSDTYCAYIQVQLGNSSNAATKRHYIAIIDRSNCWQQGDLPLVRAFAEIK